MFSLNADTRQILLLTPYQTHEIAEKLRSKGWLILSDEKEEWVFVIAFLIDMYLRERNYKEYLE